MFRMQNIVAANGTSRIFGLVVKRWTNHMHYASSSLFKPTSYGDIVKQGQGDVDKKRDPTMMQEIDIEKLPRAQRRHVEEFLKSTEARASALDRLSYKNLAAFAILFTTAGGVYLYTYYGLRQETFLEEIDREVAAETAQN